MADSWLLQDGMDRERMLDMDERIRKPRMAVLGLLGVALIAATPWMGAETIVFAVIAVLVAGALFKVAADRTPNSERPEYYLFAGWAGSEVVIAVCIMLTGGAQSPALAWLAIPVVTLSARFSLRGVVVGVLVVEALLGLIWLSSGWEIFADQALWIGATAALIITVAILSSALMYSDLEHRSDALIDPLTGLLNRAALHNRSLELKQRSQYVPKPVAVIVGDIDHFKRINDNFGHAVGDAVLQDIAYVMRNDLRAFDLVFRIGGEEFLVLVPGADVDTATELTRELHRAIGAETHGGVPVTMSFGVAATQYGDMFDFDEVFARADLALYSAKKGGRNQVRAAAGDGSVEVTEAHPHIRV